MALHGQTPYCSFHPRERVVGVCAQCLKDRLLLLLAASSSSSSSKDKAELRFRRRTSSNSSISFPKVFALGSSFLQRLDSRHHHEEADAAAAAAYSDDDTTSVASLDDSFISIKFEDTGKGTWDKQKQQQQQQLTGGAGNNKAPLRSSSSSSSTAVVAVVEHVKWGGASRWRKQVVGRLLQLARWKRSVAERSKARSVGRSWIRSLTRRRERPWS